MSMESFCPYNCVPPSILRMFYLFAQFFPHFGGRGPQIPIVVVISDTDFFLQKLVVEKKNLNFQFLFLYYVYRGLKGFVNVPFWF